MTDLKENKTKNKIIYCKTCLYLKIVLKIQRINVNEKKNDRLKLKLSQKKLYLKLENVR